MAKKRPNQFQLIIQIGNFPRISRYYASGIEYPTREATIAAGEKWLKGNGYEVSRKYIHTRHVKRGNNLMPKHPKLERDLTPRNRHSLGRMYWLHEKRTRQQLGQVDSKGRALPY